MYLHIINQHSKLLDIPMFQKFDILNNVMNQWRSQTFMVARAMRSAGSISIKVLSTGLFRAGAMA